MSMETKVVLCWAGAIMLVFVLAGYAVSLYKQHFDPEQKCFQRSGVVIKTQFGWQCETINAKDK